MIPINGFCINLKPTSYSKAKTVKDVINCIEAAPRQEPNSLAALEGKVLEFVELGTMRPVGTLHEYREMGYIQFIIQDNDGGKINVQVCAAGFEVVE